MTDSDALPIINDPTGEVAVNLAETARLLFSAGSVIGTMQQVVDLAVSTIGGCDFAGIFVLDGDKVITPAATHPIVAEIDALQHSCGEGPCLEALAEGTTLYADDLADAPRWPSFGPEAVTKEVRSVLAFALRSNGTLGALNLYATHPRAFGAVDRAKGLILAELAGVALASAATHELEERVAVDLHAALDTREMIGEAKGILMERDRISGDQAFDILRRASQHLNIKLRDVAQALVDTGEKPFTGSASP